MPGGTALDIHGYIRSQYQVFPSGLKIAIRYSDELGYVTDRTITPIKYFEARDGREFLRAWCYLRNAERTFRMDRIITARVIEGTNKTVTYTAPTRTASVVERSSPPRHGASHENRTVAEIQASPPRPATQAKRKSHHFLLKAVCAAAIVLAVRWYFTENESDSYATPSKIHTVVAKTRPAPVSRTTAVKPIHVVSSYVNSLQSTASNRMTADTQKSAYEILLEAKAALFSNTTGLASKKLIHSYASADTDRNGQLSWSEIGSFQRALYRDYSYKMNKTALRPDEFIESGGGDCEDWSLVTAGLLRFWGYKSYIGSIRSPDDSQAHALCLIKSIEKPKNSFYFHFSEGGAFNGTQIDAGYYIPIDYDNVGSLSNAVESNWKLKKMYIPENIYGAAM